MVEHKNEYTTVLYILIVLAALAVVAIAQEKNAVVRLDPALDAIVEPDSRVEKIADGFKFTEGPAWVRSGGYLVFSDIPENKIYRWNPKDGTTSVLLEHVGFTGTDATGIGKEQSNGFETVLLIGSNGITIDLQDRLVYVAMGDRQIVRLEKDGSRTVLASQYQGKRLNSGNDLVYKSDGSLYFTDPPACAGGI